MKKSDLSRMREALYKAIAHVQRQIYAGKHEQDRKDAQTWLAEYADLVEEIQASTWKTNK
jgi:hypothetical protein